MKDLDNNNKHIFLIWSPANIYTGQESRYVTETVGEIGRERGEIGGERGERVCGGGVGVY